jgi:hypothetical protein
MVENMPCKSIRAHYGWRLLCTHEEALKVFVTVRRFGQYDPKGLKLLRKPFAPPNMLLLCPVEPP